jgi:hypothetical protein
MFLSVVHYWFFSILNYFVQCGRLTLGLSRKPSTLISVIRRTFCMSVVKWRCVPKILLPGSGNFHPWLDFVVVETQRQVRGLVRRLKSSFMTGWTVNNRSISGTGKVKSDSWTCSVCTFLQGRTWHARGFTKCYAIIKRNMLSLRGSRFFHMIRNW